MSEYKSLLEQILGSQIVAYHPVLAKMVGGVKAAIFLSQMFYYDQKQDQPGEWFAVKMSTIEERTGLNDNEQSSARKSLIHHGVLEVKRKGVPCKNFYKVNLDALTEIANQDSQKLDDKIPENSESRFLESGNLDSQKVGIIKESFKESFKESLKDKDSSPKNGDGNRKRKLSPREEMKIRLCDYFAEISGHVIPEIETISQGKAFGKLWGNPIYHIMKSVDDRENDAMALIQEAYKRLSKNGMTIKGPSSLIGTCDSIIAEVKRGVYKQEYSFESEMQKFMDWSTMEAQSGE